ncbi:hypothetical protein [Streptomyces sp. NPDC102476]|uniref:hypothetical protein n=1 Tax=Streptomyces sp. NPDC102476 TaxID=3366181 RepID=UPI003806AD1D
MGERLLPSWLRNELRPVLAFAGAGTALWTGSIALAARAWTQLRERLSLQESLGALALGAYVAGYGCWHAPHIARFAIPAAIVTWCTAAWLAAPDPDTEPDDEPATPDPEDLLDLVRDLIGDDRGILLTALCTPLHAPSTRVVRERLAAAGIPVSAGVRTPAGNGPGVHRKDLPAPSPLSDPLLHNGVAAGETANANTDNKLRVESREGMTIINDPADRHRAHSLKKAP